MARAKKPRKKFHPKVDNKKTLEVLKRVAARAREFRDEMAAELERAGVRVVKSGNVEVKLEPFNGVGSVTWHCWRFEFPEGE